MWWAIHYVNLQKIIRNLRVSFQIHMTFYFSGAVQWKGFTNLHSEEEINSVYFSCLKLFHSKHIEDEWEGGHFSNIIWSVKVSVISAARNELPLCRKIPFNRMSGGVTPPSQSLIGAAGGAASPSLLHIINTIVFVES